MRTTWIGFVACVVVLGALESVASADETADRGRAILAEHGSAVVTVVSVLSVSYGGGEDEREMESNGTVIDPNGLTVLSLGALEPMRVFEKTRGVSGKATSKIVSLKILLDDDQEIQAEVVLRDDDLDLAFIRPVKKPDTPFPYVDLDDSDKPELLDEIVILARLGKVTRRAPSVMIERVETIMHKPRDFFLVGLYRGRATVCSPAFTLEGKFIGIGVYRAIKGAQGGGMGDNLVIGFVCAEDIKEGADQAPPFEDESS